MSKVETTKTPDIPKVIETEKRIVIVVEGGCIVSVHCDDPDNTVIEIRDYDTQEKTGFIDEKEEDVDLQVISAETMTSLPKIRSTEEKKSL